MFTNSEEIFLILDYKIDLSFRALHFYILILKWSAGHKNCHSQTIL